MYTEYDIKVFQACQSEHKQKEDDAKKMRDDRSKQWEKIAAEAAEARQKAAAAV